MRENGEQRVRQQEEDKQRQLMKVASRREEQARYRDVLDIQVGWLDRATRKRAKDAQPAQDDCG